METSAPLKRVEPLVSPYGPVSAAETLSFVRGMGRVTVCGTSIGSGIPGVGTSPKQTRGLGAALDMPSQARLIAIAEGAERYAAGDFIKERPIWATRSELPGPSMELDHLPRCSAREYENPGCPFRPFDPAARIRWLRGADLVAEREVWVPAVMACYQLRESNEAERFWYRISTGYAVHSDPVDALVRGICEVAERDAAAVVWLQKLPLPELTASRPGWSSAAVEYLTSWCRQHFLEPHLFDATTDTGVPTVYCLLLSEHDKRVRQVMGCSSSRTMAQAAEKTLFEAILARSMLCSADEVPASFGEFLALEHGARFMADPARAEAFDFLAGQPRPAGPEFTELPADPGEALRHLIGVLGGKGMQLIAVDHTSAELAAAGLTATSVLIPELQPMALMPLGQFRGHSRLRQAPAAMGYRVLPEEEMNPWPQPFA
jgi:ribosomal protein S12 methylthiotransferase accessory factor